MTAKGARALEASIIERLEGRSLVLVGMMGAGKSSVGRRLGNRLRLPFADADTEIEAAANASIPEIFQTHGEAYFRDGERRVIQRLLDEGPKVLATGGGAVMNDETRAAIKARAVSIWIKADLDLLLSRVKRRSNRPLLKEGDPKAILTRLLNERGPTYALADIHIQSRDVAHDVVVGDIINALNALLEEQQVT